MQLFLKRFLFISAAVIFSISVFGQGYKYNLEQIKRNSKRRIELIGEKLEEIEKQKEQAKKAQEIKEIFNRAEKLYEEGKLKEAKEFYERAYKMSSDDAMQSYIRRANKAIARKERQKQEKINNLYHEAKSAYSEDSFAQAENVCKQILEIDPKHRGANAYLDEHIPSKKEQLKKQAEREKEEQAGIAKRKAEREARKRKLEAKRQKQEKINNLYRQAKSAYSQRDIDKAKEVFRQVLEIDPGHRGAKVYLENKIPNLVEHIKKNF